MWTLKQKGWAGRHWQERGKVGIFCISHRVCLYLGPCNVTTPEPRVFKNPQLLPSLLPFIQHPFVISLLFPKMAIWPHITQKISPLYTFSGFKKGNSSQILPLTKLGPETHYRVRIWDIFLINPAFLQD